MGESPYLTNTQLQNQNYLPTQNIDNKVTLSPYLLSSTGVAGPKNTAYIGTPQTAESGPTINY